MLKFWGKTKGKKLRRLWGTEFNIVKEGLAEDQVVGFIGELVRQRDALLQERERATSLSALHEQMVKQVNREAANLMMKAKREAELEAAKAIAEAKQRAQEIVAMAKKKATSAAEDLAKDILAVANRQAEITETQVKQQAQLFLIRAREQIKSEVKKEIEGAYNRLLSSLQGLIGEGQDIETEWRGKIAELWNVRAFELEEAETTFPRIGEPSLIPTTLGQIEATEEWREQPAQLQQEAAAEVPPEEEAVPEPVALATESGAEPRSPEPVAAVKEEVFEQQLPEVEKPGEGEVKATLPKYDSQALYTGVVELTVAPPVDLAKMSELYNRLQATPELRILRTVGSWDRGTVITLLLEKPIPLIGMLSEIPSVETRMQPSEKGGLLGGILGSSGEGEVKRIEITLKTN